MKHVAAFVFFFGAAAVWAGTMPPVQTVFIVVLENHDWVDFKGNPDAPYLNNSLLPIAAYCEGYYNPPNLHPSLPNYLWLEAGTNFGILDDRGPTEGHQKTTNHLVTLLNNAGISWKAYQEDISGATVPLDYTNGYAPRHNPFVYFDDVTGTNNPTYAYGIAHIRPYSEFASDLTNNTVARYNFITPNLCHDGHDSCPPFYNAVRQSDSWLAAEIPKILNSHAYQNGGAVFITWDESDSSDGPIGMVVLSPLARGGGYTNHIQYTHSSLLRTIQEIYEVRPWLGDAAYATSLSDLFYPFALRNVKKLPNGGIQLTATGVIPGWTSIVEVSVDMANWTPISTNVPGTNSFNMVDATAANLTRRFYRILQRP